MSGLEFDTKVIVMNAPKQKQQQKLSKEVQKSISQKSHQQKIAETLDNDDFSIEQDKHIMKENAKRIQQARQQKKLTQKQLAQQLNLKQNMIAELENGKRHPTPQEKIKLHKVLHIKLLK